VESNRQDLKLEDIVPDLTVPTPEQETEAAGLCLPGGRRSMNRRPREHRSGP